MPNYERQQNETGQARAARIKRETNQENDALKLVLGEWIKYGNFITRFRPVHLDRMRPRVLRRATAEEIATAEAKEAAINRRKAEIEAREEWARQPHVQAATSIRWAIEDNIEAVLQRLTPQEWIDLAAKITGGK